MKRKNEDLRSWLLINAKKLSEEQRFEKRYPKIRKKIKKSERNIKEYLKE